MKEYRNIWIILVSTIGLAAVTLSCNQGTDDRIKGDVVFIPNTADGEADMDRLPAFEFTELTHDFGKVIRGEVVSYAFRFVNTGNTDLLIADISSSCGCGAALTAAKYRRPCACPYCYLTNGIMIQNGSR